jgi:TM2 domain-containing membrane protein YozV
MALITCPECEKQISNRAKACPYCGVPICDEDQAICSNQQVSVVVKSQRSRGIAILLAIFLGSIGAHRFYIGHYGVALLYLLFSWTLIPAVIGLIEGVILIIMSETSFQEKIWK